MVGCQGYMDFMFDELFQPDYTMPERVSAEDAKAILSDFAGMFDENDTPDGFFDKMKQIASAHATPPIPRRIRLTRPPIRRRRDVSMVVRVAVVGPPERTGPPDRNGYSG